MGCSQIIVRGKFTERNILRKVSNEQLNLHFKELWEEDQTKYIVTEGNNRDQRKYKWNKMRRTVENSETNS